MVTSNMAVDSKPRLAGNAGTSVLRNWFSAVARISNWITEIFGTSYKMEHKTVKTSPLMGYSFKGATALSGWLAGDPTPWNVTQYLVKLWMKLWFLKPHRIYFFSITIIRHIVSTINNCLQTFCTKVIINLKVRTNLNTSKLKALWSYGVTGIKTLRHLLTYFIWVIPSWNLWPFMGGYWLIE